MWNPFHNKHEGEIRYDFNYSLLQNDEIFFKIFLIIWKVECQREEKQREREGIISTGRCDSTKFTYTLSAEYVTI